MDAWLQSEQAAEQLISVHNQQRYNEDIGVGVWWCVSCTEGLGPSTGGQAEARGGPTHHRQGLTINAIETDRTRG